MWAPAMAQATDKYNAMAYWTNSTKIRQHVTGHLHVVSS